MGFSTIPELLSDLRAGKMVIIADDEARENEGDLIMAASMVRPEDINFMARHARGLICLGLSKSLCEKLGLRLMVSDNRTQFQTAFTVSIEAAEGVTTGISAFDRAHTIRTAVSANASASDLRQPGHVFPLMAQPGGVLTRAGHTEAACDLPALAGLEPAGVLVEILAEDGTMARRPELEQFAQAHGLRMGTIAELISYRLETEQTVQRLHEAEVHSEFGAFRLVIYRDLITKSLHYAMVRGTPDPSRATLVRVHPKQLLSDLLTITSAGASIPLRASLAAVAEAGEGVVVVLQQPESGEAELAKLCGVQAVQGDLHEWRTHGLGAQILADLGVRKLRVLGTPRRFTGLGGFGLEVVEQVPLTRL